MNECPSSPLWLDYVSALGPVILTFALIVVTFLYTRATRKMAEVIAKEYEYRISPAIEFIKGSATKSYPEYTTSFSLKNIGSFVCYVQKITLIWYLVEDSDKRGTKTLEEKEKVINPGSDYYPSYPVRLMESDFSQLGIETTRAKYSIGKDIKIIVELEIAGPDKKFRKRTYFVS